MSSLANLDDIVNYFRFLGTICQNFKHNLWNICGISQMLELKIFSKHLVMLFDT